MKSATQGAVAQGEPKAWVEMASEADVLSQMSDHPYSLGFVPAMARLLRTHPRLGAVFVKLYAEIMFSPDGMLSRKEREMVAVAAATAQDCFY